MKKTVLDNSLRILYKYNNSNIITINLSVLVGSNNESKANLGICHFMEHMMFEGTKNRSALKLSSEIERYGGEMNAYTSNEKTNYFIKIHKRRARKAIEILADMMINPLFDKKAIKKEKNVVLEEINMVNDNPRQYQWVLLGKRLFDRPLSNPAYGTKETVSNISRADLLTHHKRFYTPNNMILTIVGDCKGYLNLVKKFFRIRNKGIKIKNPSFILNNKKASYYEKKKNINQQYLIIGYRVPKRLAKASYILDVIGAILARGQSGRLYDEIRTKRGLTYDLGIFHGTSSYYGFFAFHSSASKENIKLIEKIYFDELEKLKDIKQEALDEAISYIEGNFTIKMEDSHEQADTISFFEECGCYKEYGLYLKKIRKVTIRQISDTIEKYLNKNYTKVMLK